MALNVETEGHGDTTQWEDIHVKLGNFAPRPKKVTNDQIEKVAVEFLESYDPLEKRTLGELKQMEDDVEEDTLESYRKKRLAELKAKQRSAKFGTLLRVDKQNFVREVTDASADGQWVAVLLIVEAQGSSQRMVKPWEEMARRHPAVKFMVGIAANVMPNYPDASTPLVLLYRNRDDVKQIVGLGEWGGARCSTDTVEWVLAEYKVVETELDEDPRTAPAAASSWRRPARGDDSEDEDEDATDDRCYSSTLIGRNWPKRS